MSKHEYECSEWREQENFREEARDGPDEQRGNEHAPGVADSVQGCSGCDEERNNGATKTPDRARVQQILQTSRRRERS